nr:hypothetical protein [Tanacetum cinerariifolium]
MELSQSNRPSALIIEDWVSDSEDESKVEHPTQAENLRKDIPKSRDYSLWEVILNGDSPPSTRTIDGVVQIVDPTTAEKMLAWKNKLKARGILLMALLDKHQLKFNIHKNAKSLMEAIEQIPLGLTCPKLNVTIAIEENILPENADHQGTTGTKKLLDELSQWWNLLQMLSCLSVIPLVVMIRLFKLKKNLLIMHLWLTPLQARQFLRDQTMSEESKNKVTENQENDRYKTCEGYHVVPPPYTRNFLPSKPDLVFTDDIMLISDSEVETEIESVPKQREPNFVQITTHVKTSRESVKKLSIINKLKTLGKTLKSLKYNEVSVNTARPVTTAVTQSTVKCARPVKNVFNKAHSPVRKLINQRTTTKNSNFNKKVNIVNVNKVNVVQGNKGNAEKASACWV